MKKLSLIFAVVFILFAPNLFAQEIPTATLVQIVKAEDELRFDQTLENLMKNANAKIRARAALAAGRTGKTAAIPALINLLSNDAAAEVRMTAAFALGELEDIAAADAILKVLQDEKTSDQIRARTVESAGKIAAANLKEAKAVNLREAILDALEKEDQRGDKQNKETILLGLTAILRAKPAEGDYEGGFVAAKFLTNLDGRIRADAANTLTRLRAKNFNEKLLAMVLSDSDPIARANAARALGAAEDKDAFNPLLETALTDEDSRVRVSAIRSLGSLKNAEAAPKLIERGEKLFGDYQKSKDTHPPDDNEFLEIASALGNLLKNSNNEKAVNFLMEYGLSENFLSPEIHIAFAKISPSKYLEVEPPNNICNVNSVNFFVRCWQFYSSNAQGLGEFADLDNKNPLRIKAEEILLKQLKYREKSEFGIHFDVRSIPETLRAFSQFKSKNADEILKSYLANYRDVFVRATAAELLAEQPATKENVEALKNAFIESLKEDEKFVQDLKQDKNDYNDAQLAILSALVKLDKRQSFESLRLALNAPDYLVRRRAADLIKENDLAKDFRTVENYFGTLKPYNAKTGTKLGQILNTKKDYRRAVSRQSASAKIETEKGTFTIEFFPNAAPLTVDNFIKLAKSGYFNNVAIHRVVPNFVVQDGDPRGDGNGGPGWEIRDEINMISYERGTVGMALSGANTGGSQWFVTHSPQPHLDGGYTVFGKVSEADMKIVDNLTRGDKILRVTIEENGKRKMQNGK